jgi:hypothetical protein
MQRTQTINKAFNVFDKDNREYNRDQDVKQLRPLTPFKIDVI